MNILFLGVLFDRRNEDHYLKKSRVGLQNATNNFQWNIIDGLIESNECKLKIINVLPVGTYPRKYKDVILNTKKWKYKNTENIEIGSPNIIGIKQIWRMHSLRNRIEEWIRQDINNRTIIVYSLYEPAINAINQLRIKYNNLKLCLIVPDIPSKYGSTHKKVKNIILNWRGEKVLNALSKIDCFIVLTSYMKEPLKIKDRPYIVVEGLINSSNVINEDKTYGTEERCNKKIVFYSGSLSQDSGTDDLINAFQLIEDSNYELWIAGSGKSKSYVEECAKRDKRIKYFGYLPHNSILKLQRQSTLLINPRTNKIRHAKYSFPSKTIEYMLSGTPVLMNKLDGIPNEYDEYLFYIDGGSIHDLKSSIVRVCEIDRTELLEFGAQAKKFVVENKNSTIQAKKILDFLES